MTILKHIAKFLGDTSYYYPILYIASIVAAEFSGSIGAMTWQNQQSDCAPSKDSDHPLKSLRYALNGLTQAFFMRTAKTLIRLGGCPGWSESSLGAIHFVGFVMSWLMSVHTCGSFLSSSDRASIALLNTSWTKSFSSSRKNKSAINSSEFLVWDF